MFRSPAQDQQPDFEDEGYDEGYDGQEEEEVYRDAQGDEYVQGDEFDDDDDYEPMSTDREYAMGIDGQDLGEPQFMDPHDIDPEDEADYEDYLADATNVDNFWGHGVDDLGLNEHFSGPGPELHRPEPLDPEDEQQMAELPNVFGKYYKEPQSSKKKQNIPATLPLAWDPLYGGTVPETFHDRPLVKQPELQVLKQHNTKKLLSGRDLHKVQNVADLPQDVRESLAPALIGNIDDINFPIPDHLKTFEYEETLRKRRVERFVDFEKRKKESKYAKEQERLKKENARGTDDDFERRRGQKMSDAERSRLFRRKSIIKRLYAQGRDPESIIRAHHYATHISPLVKQSRIERWMEFGITRAEAERRLSLGLQPPAMLLPRFDRKELERQMRSRKPRNPGEKLIPTKMLFHDMGQLRLKAQLRGLYGDMATTDDDDDDTDGTDPEEKYHMRFSDLKASPREVEATQQEFKGWVIDSLNPRSVSLLQGLIRDMEYSPREGPLYLPEDLLKDDLDKMEGIRVAHLTDLNFTSEWNIENLRDMITNTARLKRFFTQWYSGERNMYSWVFREDVLKKIDELSPDLIICTGNITQSGLEEEFDSAFQDLKALMNKYPFFLVPGRNDVVGVDPAKTEYHPLLKHFSDTLHTIIPQWALPTSAQRFPRVWADIMSSQETDKEKKLQELEAQQLDPLVHFDHTSPINIRPDGTQRDTSQLTRLLVTTEDNLLSVDIQAQYPHLSLFLTKPFTRLNEPGNPNGAMKLVNKVTNAQLREVAKDSWRTLPPRQLVYTKDDVEAVNLQRRKVDVTEVYDEDPPEEYSYGPWVDPKNIEESKKTHDYLQTERVTQLDPRFFPTSPNNNQVLVIGLNPNRPAELGDTGLYPLEQLHELQALLNNKKHIMNNQFAELTSSEPLEESTIPFIILATHYPVVDKSGYDHAQVHPEDAAVNNHQLLHILDSAQIKPGLIVHGHDVTGGAQAIAVQRNLHYNAMTDRLYPCVPPEVDMPHVPPLLYDINPQHTRCENTPEENIYKKKNFSFLQRCGHVWKQLEGYYKLHKYRIKLMMDKDYFRREVNRQQSDRFSPRLSLLHGAFLGGLGMDDDLEEQKRQAERYDHDLNPYKPSSQSVFDFDIPQLPPLFSNLEAYIPAIREVTASLQDVYTADQLYIVETGLTLDELQQAQVNTGRDMMLAAEQLGRFDHLEDPNLTVELQMASLEGESIVKRQTANYCHATLPLDVESYLNGTLQPFTRIKAPLIENVTPLVRKRAPPVKYQTMMKPKQFQRFSQSSSYQAAQDLSSNPMKSAGVLRRMFRAGSGRAHMGSDDGTDDQPLDVSAAIKHIATKRADRRTREDNVAGMHRFITQMIGASDYAQQVHDNMLEKDLSFDNMYKKQPGYYQDDPVVHHRGDKIPTDNLLHPVVASSRGPFANKTAITTPRGDFHKNEEFAHYLLNVLNESGMEIEDVRKRHNEAAEMINMIKTHTPRGPLPSDWTFTHGAETMDEYKKRLSKQAQQRPVMHFFDIMDQKRRLIHNQRFRYRVIQEVRKSWLPIYLERNYKMSEQILDTSLYPFAQKQNIDRKRGADDLFVAYFRNRKQIDDQDMTHMDVPLPMYQDLTPKWKIPNPKEVLNLETNFGFERLQTTGATLAPFNLLQYQQQILQLARKRIQEQRWWDKYTLFKDGVTRPHPEEALSPTFDTILPNSLTEQYMDPAYVSQLLPVLDPNNPAHEEALADRYRNIEHTHNRKVGLEKATYSHVYDLSGVDASSTGRAMLKHDDTFVDQTLQMGRVDGKFQPPDRTGVQKTAGESVRAFWKTNDNPEAVVLANAQIPVGSKNVNASGEGGGSSSTNNLTADNVGVASGDLSTTHASSSSATGATTTTTTTTSYTENFVSYGDDELDKAFKQLQQTTNPLYKLPGPEDFDKHNQAALASTPAVPQTQRGPVLASSSDTRLYGHLPQLFPGGIQQHREKYELMDTQHLFNTFQEYSGLGVVDVTRPIADISQQFDQFITTKIFIAVRRGFLHHDQAKAVLTAQRLSNEFLLTDAVKQYKEQIEKQQKRKKFLIDQIRGGYQDKYQYMDQIDNLIRYYHECLTILPQRVDAINNRLQHYLVNVDRIPSHIVLDRLKSNREEFLRQLYDETFTLGVTLDVLDQFFPPGRGNLTPSKQDSVLKLHGNKLSHQHQEKLNQFLNTTPWLGDNPKLQTYQLLALSQSEKQTYLADLWGQMKPLVEQHLEDTNNPLFNDALIEIENKLIDYAEMQNTTGFNPLGEKPMPDLTMSTSVVTQLLKDLDETVKHLERQSNRAAFAPGKVDTRSESVLKQIAEIDEKLANLDNNRPNEVLTTRLDMHKRQKLLVSLLKEHQVLTEAYNQLPVIPLSQRVDARLQHIKPPKVTIPIHNPGPASIKRHTPRNPDDPWVSAPGFNLYTVLPRNELEQRLLLAKTMFHKNEIKFPNNGNSFVSGDYYSLAFRHYVHDGEALVEKDLPYTYDLW